MPNGTYGRAVPRLALAVAEYRHRFGAWPTHAHGSGVMAIVREPDDHSDADDHIEYSSERASRVLSRLTCDGDGAWIEVSGPEGRCSYGSGSPDHLKKLSYVWLYEMHSPYASGSIH